MMHPKVTIDRGNTALKATLWSPDDSPICSVYALEDETPGQMVQRLCAEAAVDIPEAAFCTTVPSCKDSDTESLRKVCHNVTVLSADTPMPMSIQYATPRTLGPDRIAAALGAIKLCGTDTPLVVADLGTANTYDIVLPDAVFAGGNIAPGIDMRLQALAANTAALPLVSPDEPDTPVWGDSTAQALRAGALRGVEAELEFYLRSAGPDARLLISGGSAAAFLKNINLQFSYIYHPSLVQLGLLSLLDQPETTAKN